MEDRSALFNQLKEFSQRKLKKVETKVVTGLGEQLVEKRGAKGLQVLKGGDGAGGNGDSAKQEPARKLDLQVGFVLPGLLMGSQDVAHDKSSLESYGIEYILNLDKDVGNKFEDDYNYKNVAMKDTSDFRLEQVLDDCFDFIDDGRHRSNVFVHCSGTIGLSRSTAICVAYLMNKEKQTFNEAFNTVKEARSFVKPNEGFMKQLQEYEVKLRGAQQVKDSGIDDPFALRKKQEIEQEKAMVAGAASVKNRMKMFGATLDTAAAAAADSPRSKSVSPMPMKQQQESSSPKPASKWSKPAATPSPATKSMTPEPRSWSSSKTAGPPPPPPPPPAAPLHANNTSKSFPPPPPPPPPQPTGSLLDSNNSKSSSSNSKRKTSISSSSSKANPTTSKPTTTPTKTTTTTTTTTTSTSNSNDDTKQVFGRRPPPPMKLRGGISMERSDSISSNDSKQTNTKSHTKGSLQLPLKRQFTTSDSDGDERAENPRAPSPSAALRAAKQQAASSSLKQNTTNDGKLPPSSGGGGGGGGEGGGGGGGLNRSSTKKLLNLIKTKTRTDLTLPDGDENDEIEALLGALESESIDNIDWDELGLDEAEVKDIIKRGGESASESESSEDDDEEDEDEDEEEEEVETSTMHYVIRTK